ncbi:hypothetical protein FGO68_gene8317 [Halteria grandinella]|uniref:Uncharacterized protein n=1 Tax=Halteria grandinella TaxID=5974 RepID=A0A8J8P3U8_HALGN|nr:hypothetical protein FGO68_gene8317 [Halteria grandinella]
MKPLIRLMHSSLIQVREGFKALFQKEIEGRTQMISQVRSLKLKQSMKSKSPNPIRSRSDQASLQQNRINLLPKLLQVLKSYPTFTIRISQIGLLIIQILTKAPQQLRVVISIKDRASLQIKQQDLFPMIPTLPLSIKSQHKIGPLSWTRKSTLKQLLMATALDRRKSTWVQHF